MRFIPTDDPEICIVEQVSPFSGKTNQAMIRCTWEQLNDYQLGRGLVQNIFPDLTADEREFIMTGITPDEFPSDPDE